MVPLLNLKTLPALELLGSTAHATNVKTSKIADLATTILNNASGAPLEEVLEDLAKSGVIVWPLVIPFRPILALAMSTLIVVNVCKAPTANGVSVIWVALLPLELATMVPLSTLPLDAPVNPMEIVTPVVKLLVVNGAHLWIIAKLLTLLRVDLSFLKTRLVKTSATKLDRTVKLAIPKRAAPGVLLSADALIPGMLLA